MGIIFYPLAEGDIRGAVARVADEEIHHLAAHGVALAGPPHLVCDRMEEALPVARLVAD